MNQERSANIMDRKINNELLTNLPVPPMLDSQLSEFTADTIHSKAVMEFDASKSQELLSQNEGREVLVADFGGDKGRVNLLKVVNGELVNTKGYEDYIQGDDGKGYLDTIMRATEYAEQQKLPFGLSWGGPLDGTKILYQPKAKILIKELSERFDGDFANISGSLKVVLNDGPAGVIGGVMHAYKEFSATEIILVINGGGIGLGALKDGVVSATEAGHVKAIDALNKDHIEAPCGVFDQEFTCLENIGSNKKGIEPLYKLLTGESISAKEIEQKYYKGDSRAKEVYELSALVVAHAIAGSANSLGIDLYAPKTAIVADGSAFKFPYYGDRIKQILGNGHSDEPQLLMTKDQISPDSNVFLHGVALAALAKSDNEG